MKSFPVLMFLLFSIASFGQCPIIDFDVATDGCLNEKIEIHNSTTADSLIWDFCSNDLQELPDIKIEEDLGNLSSQPFGLEVLKDNNNWFGFILNRGGGKLLRLDYGNSISNEPEIIDLGNPSNLLNQPEHISFLKYESKWYAVVTQNLSSPNNEVILLEFNKDIKSTPTARVLSNFGLTNKIRAIKVVNDDSNIILLVANSGKKLTIINYRDSFQNMILPEHILSTPDISGANLIFSLDAIKVCDNWYVFAGSFVSNAITTLKFGPNLFSLPLEDSSVIFPDIDTPYDISIIPQGESIFLAASSFDRGSSIISYDDIAGSRDAKLVVNSINSLPKLSAVDFAFDQGSIYLIGIHTVDRVLYKIKYASSCGINEEAFSTNSSPIVVYDSSGKHTISLNAINKNGSTQGVTKSIDISNFQSPQISAFISGNCLTNPIDFSSEQIIGNIISWNWEFGDGIGTSNLMKDTYTYSSIGNYKVKLQVTDNNGCNNIVIDSIQIFNEPLPSFSIQANSLCTNNAISFSNTSSGETGSIVTWNWVFNGESSSGDMEVDYTFTTGGDKTVTLSASIPGCINETSQTISITPGPLTGFTPGGSCVYDNYIFTNTTTGDDITGFLWDFGDGYTSTNISPMHQYQSGGTYAVSLTASNVLGCNTTLEQIVPVYFIPTPNFISDLACSDNSVTFYDQSSVVGANITDQKWTLIHHDLNYEQSASGSTPKFRLGEAGDYEMTLIATSNFGCSDTLTRNDITVRPSPAANFTFENLCFGDSTIFNEIVDLPTNIGLNSVEWLINGMIYSGENIKHKFASADTFSVEMYVRADNFCTDYTSKTLSILPLPEIGIDLSTYCADQPVTIYSSINSADPVIAYNWQINDKPVSNLERFIYDFDKADLYNIGLGVTTENNCYNFQSQEFTIHPSPVSVFELFPSIGANPLSVAFTDLSIGASKVLYDFSENNDDTSEDFNPNYTYTQLGKDWPKQIVENDFGCTDTSYNEIEVVIPVYDLKLSNANIEVIDQKLKIVIEIINNGSIIVNNPEVRIDIDKKISLSHKLECRVWPGDQRSFEIDFDVILNNQSLNYLCFSLNTELGNYIDVNPFDNSECLSIESTFNVLEPYPNPSRDFVFVPIILPSPGACEILMTNEKGAMLFQNQYKNLKSGLNLFKIDLSIYNQGLYMLVIKHDQFENTKKIFIN